MSRYIEIGGISVTPYELKTNSSKELAEFLESGLLNYVKLVDCRINSDKKADIIIFDITVELAQRQIYDIREIERIACVFSHDDSVIPIVYALRDDFPLTPHMNQQKFEYPRCLCIFDEDEEDLKISWSAPELVYRIAVWLLETSMNTLHSQDQPLEPFLYFAQDSLVLPTQYYENPYIPQRYKLSERVSENGGKTYIAHRFESDMGEKAYVPITVVSDPVEHGVIRKLPGNLYELIQISREAGIDLLSIIINQLKDIKEHLTHQQYETHGLIIILVLPKKRDEKGKEEHYEFRAFLLKGSILQLGVCLGIWQVMEGRHLGLVLEPDEIEKPGLDIIIHPLNVLRPFNKEFASEISGYTTEDCKIAMVGAGALGSHLICNLVRSGFGKWTVIDKDDLYPHNLGRHILNFEHIGLSKATSVANYVNSIISGDKVAEGIVVNILKPEINKKKVMDTLISSDIILDVSTSIAVERYLALDVESRARRVSAFLNPAGTDLVMIIEDSERQLKLDFLEMQYYRSIINIPELEHHLAFQNNRIRYGNSCRDISNRIPEDYISMLSSICSAYFRRIVNKNDAEVHVWQIEPESFSVKHHNIEIYKKLYQETHNGWTVIIDEYVNLKIKKLRDEKLPLETGGVLIGSYDMQRRIIYVVDTIPSPPDSEEKPISYIRGCVGLRDKVEKVSNKTQKRLEYVGEWHSHPKGYSGEPSEYDIKLLEYVSRLMKYDGHPGLMIICSDSGLKINIL